MKLILHVMAIRRYGRLVYGALSVKRMALYVTDFIGLFIYLNQPSKVASGLSYTPARRATRDIVH